MQNRLGARIEKPPEGGGESAPASNRVNGVLWVTPVLNDA